MRENNYLPSMIFFFRKSLIKIVLGQNLFIFEPDFQIFAAHFSTKYVPGFARKYFAYS